MAEVLLLVANELWNPLDTHDSSQASIPLGELSSSV